MQSQYLSIKFLSVDTVNPEVITVSPEATKYL